MKFTTIEIENFLAIGEAKLALSDRGLVVIQGANEDNTSSASNGAGKSSLPDALCWALYGTTARGVSGDEVINDKALKNCRVAVNVQDGLDAWRIERHRKHKTHKNSLRLVKIDGLTGTETDLSKGKDALTQVEVEKVIGSSLDVFRASIYAGQEQMPNLPAMTDKQLKMLVEEAAGVTLLEAAYKEANLRLNAAKQSSAGAKVAIDAAESQIQNAKNAVLAAQVNESNWAKSRDQMVQALKGDAQAIVGNLKLLDAEIAKIDIKQTTLDIAAVEAKINGIKGEQTKERSLVAAVNDKSKLYAEATVEAKRQADKMAAKVNDLKQVNMIVGSPCGECGKPYCEHDVEDRRKILGAEITQLKSDWPSFTAKLKEASEKLLEAQGQLSAHQAGMTDVSGETASLSALNAIVKDYETKQLQRKSMAERARDKVEQAKTKAAEPNPFSLVIDNAKTDLDAAVERKAKAEKTYDACVEKEKMAETVSKVFSPSGVRAHILDEVTPYLNDQTAKYLGTLTDGNTTATWTTLVKNAKGELREKFSIDVEDAQGGKSFALLSGGEKRKVRIAASLALQDLVARRATKPIELFVGDEIDDALDTPGLERLTSILDEKAKERGTVLVISHNDLTDWVSNVITVTKKAGRATITEDAQ